MLNVAIRADASVSTGTGHIVRCLTLADLLHKHLDANITFLCCEIPAILKDSILSKGYGVIRIGNGRFTNEKEDAELALGSDKKWDWMIVDHYQLGRYWETAIRSHAAKVMVIDDLADRSHECELLLDQNYYSNMAIRYEGLVPQNCKLCLGPQYALLRPQFYVKRRSNQGNGIRNVLVFFGGSDPTNETAKALKAIESSEFKGIQFDVVVGASNPNRRSIELLCGNTPNLRFHCQIEDMASLMNSADLALGAGGTTHWERLYLGLPAIVISVADNQIETTSALADQGIIKYLGHYSETTDSMIAESVRFFLDFPGKIQTMKEAARALLPDQAIDKIHPIISVLSEVRS